MTFVSPTESTPRSVAWWLYFVLLCGIEALSLIAGPSNSVDFLLSIFNLFSLVGLWRYFRQIAGCEQTVWIGYFIVSVLFSALAFSLNLIQLDSGELPFARFWSAVALVFPLYVALWRYAFGSTALWSDART